QPNSRYVADFIGNINLIEGRIEGGSNGRTRLKAMNGDVAIESDGAVDAAQGAVAWFAIRPEKMRLALDPPHVQDVNALSGEVIDIGYLGDVSIYHVRLPGGAMVKATTTNTTRLVERPITWHDKIWLSWTRDAGVVLTR
ncbi:MAG: TOBE domain-containing protein, partial [Bauldia sp.]